MTREFTSRWLEKASGYNGRLYRSGLAFVVPIVGITLSEGLVFTGRLELALWGHLTTLLFCAAAPLALDDEAHTFRAFALVPLFRLVNLGVPVFIELTLLWLPLVYGPLLPGLYLVTRQQAPLSISSESVTEFLLLLPLATALSLFLAALEYQIIQPPALIPTWNLSNIIALSLVMLLFVGLVEELLFRGILQRTLVNRLGTFRGVLIAAFLFGVMHSAFGQLLEIAFASVFGLILGGIYSRTDNLVIVTYIHGTLNVFLLGLFPTYGPFLGL